VRRLLPWFFFALATLFTASAFGDAATEKAAQALQKKAIEEDNLNVNYPAAIKKLQAAINKCGADKCGPKLRASLVRDLGAMQVLNGDVPAGQASFDTAAGMDATMALDPSYANPTLNGMWAASVKKAGGGGAPPSGSSGGGSSGGTKPPSGSSGGGSSGGATQPTGDFVHSPPPEALDRTPLPVYVEYGGSEKLTRVTVKYKGFGMTDWKPLDLPKVGSGYGAMIPCKDVSQGNFQYYIQGYANDDNVATSGSRNKPFIVPVKKEIAGDPPALPGQDPPKQCAEGTGEECPPDFPGCNNPKKDDGEDCDKDNECKSTSCVGGKCVSKKSAGEDCEKDDECNSGACADGKCTEGEAKKKAAGEDCESDGECDSGKCKEGKCEGGGKSKFPRIWVGVDIGFDLYILGGGSDVCKLNPGGNAPLSASYYCVDPSGGFNVPGSVGSQNPPADPASWNNAIVLGKSDQVSGGISPANLRLMLSFDFAVTQNILVGLRAGYTLFTYPGGNANAPASPSAPFPPLHIEARFTYLIGKDALTTPGFKPMVYAGAGVGEFDGKVGVTTILDPTATGVTNPSHIPAGAVQENAWLMAGPLFFKVGGGGRFNASKKFALTVGLGFVGAVGGTAGFLPGFEPEVGGQVGF
jgi:hypothetical protein